jgi:hypothetical protein
MPARAVARCHEHCVNYGLLAGTRAHSGVPGKLYTVKVVERFEGRALKCASDVTFNLPSTRNAPHVGHHLQKTCRRFGTARF